MRETCLSCLSFSTSLIALSLLGATACTTPLTTEGGESETSAEGSEDPSGGDGDGDATATASGDGDGDSSGPTTDPGTGDAEPLTIYELQQGAEDGTIGEGQIVTINGVVMTTGATLDDEALFWVEETGAGQWSGVSIYVWEEARAGLELVPGAEVSFTGEYTEQFSMSQVIVKNPGDITVDSSGNDVPGPDTVTGAEIAFDSLDSEPWESVHVCIDNPTVLESNDGFGQYVLGDDSGSVKVGNLFLGSLPDAAPGGTFERVCGVLNISFDEFKIQPRSAEDLVGYAGPMAVDTTIFDIQSGNVSEGSVVRLTGVVATSGFTWSDEVDASFFVQEDGGGEYKGIQVFVADTTGLTIAPGDEFTIEGTYTEFFDMSQISTTADGLMITSSGPAPAPTVIGDPASIATGGAMAENYEGCLVTVEMVTVLDDLPDAPDDFGEFTVTGDLRVDDLFFAMADWMKPAVDDNFDSITGVLVYNFSNFKLEPRDQGDLVQP